MKYTIISFSLLLSAFCFAQDGLWTQKADPGYSKLHASDTQATDEVMSDTLSATQWDQYSDNPVIRPGTSFWNHGIVYSPAVVMFKDTLRMWYMGSTAYGFNGIIHLGYAWSLDGIAWQQYAENPVFSPREGEWDYPQITNINVLVDGDTLRMWYGAGNIIQLGMRIGYAISVDCIHWNRHSEPVIVPPQSPAWNQDGVLPGAVIKEDGIYKMWFSGGVGPYGYPWPSTEWNIGYATSSDCIHWDLLPDLVLSHGDRGIDFDETIADAYVIRTDAGYHMWFSGHSKTAVSNHTPQAKIGYASSPDGIHWTKYDKNPVLSPTSVSRQWTTGYYTPSVLYDGERFQMWFSGWTEGGGNISIGYATSGPDINQNTAIEGHLPLQKPVTYALYQNYPNPFNPATTIAYTLPEPAAVRMDIFNIHGEKVISLLDAHQKAGMYSVEWDGRDSFGKPVSDGIYLSRFYTGDYNRTIRMLLLK